MSFQAYLKNIEEKTNKKPADFRKLAEEKAFTTKGKLVAKAGEIVTWLQTDYGLGHGHAMAIYALLSGKKNEDSV